MDKTFVAVVAVTGLPLWGQGIEPRVDPERPEDSGAVFRADTRVVDPHATVVDKKGRLVTDLPREAFTKLENGVPQQISSFKWEDVPISMGLVIDNSGSMLAPVRNDSKNAGKTTAGSAGFSVSRHVGVIIGGGARWRGSRGRGGRRELQGGYPPAPSAAGAMESRSCLVSSLTDSSTR